MTTKSLHRYYNPNPNKKEVADCVVRACCKSMNKDWDEVYVDLCKIGFENKAMPNEKLAYEKYFIQEGFEYVKVFNKKGSKRLKVREIAKEHKKEVIICVVANHLVTTAEGYFWDLFDSGDNSLYGYWVKINKQ